MFYIHDSILYYYYDIKLLNRNLNILSNKHLKKCNQNPEEIVRQELLSNKNIRIAVLHEEQIVHKDPRSTNNIRQ